MEEYTRFVIGIDGGGSKTNALLVALDGTVLAEAGSGPTNLHTVGVGNAARTLLGLIKTLCERVQCSADSLEQIVMGLAGAGRPADRAALSDVLFALARDQDFNLKNVQIESDALIALEAAFAGGPGIVIIAGTGSIALYRTEDGKVLRAGGWGRILGDEGGGYQIARAALNAVLRAHDGRAPHTLLTEHARVFFSIASIEQLIPTVRESGGEIAGFAPEVFAAAASRDHVAARILVDQARELVELARVLAMKQPPKRKLPVALMGGLLETDNSYSRLVRDKITNALPNLVLQKPKFPAAFGAAIIGLHAFR